MNIGQLSCFDTTKPLGDAEESRILRCSCNDRFHENETALVCLGFQGISSEKTAAVQELLCHLRERGIGSEKRYLFVIDGAKALKNVINQVSRTKALTF
jgi:hypothetical protein